MAPPSVAALRKFVRPRESEERCDLCGASLPAVHIHQFEPPTRRIRCACAGCAVLPSGNWREIPRRIIALPNFRLSDMQWDDLMIPIALAFFSYSTPAGRITALYPGPAGAAESTLRLDAWREIEDENPELQNLEPDVEALLVNRVAATREYFIAPIDECYRLVGLIRLHWRGLSGGAVVWGEIGRFFDDLRRKGA
jgi:Family of unknown function (DUF5947)